MNSQEAFILGELAEELFRKVRKKVPKGENCIRRIEQENVFLGFEQYEKYSIFHLFRIIGEEPNQAKEAERIMEELSHTQNSDYEFQLLNIKGQAVVQFSVYRENPSMAESKDVYRALMKFLKSFD